MFPNNNKTLKRKILCNLNCIFCILFVNILSININFVQVSLQNFEACLLYFSLMINPDKYGDVLTSPTLPYKNNFTKLLFGSSYRQMASLILFFTSLLMMCRRWRRIFERISSLCLVSSLSSSTTHKRTTILKWPVIISVQSLTWIGYIYYSCCPSQLWTIFQVFNPWSATMNAMYLNLCTVSSSLPLLTQMSVQTPLSLASLRWFLFRRL